MKDLSNNLIESLTEKQNLEILETLLTLNKKSYPKFGNVVILAGGAGSGKGFVKDKLLGMEGKSFDVDRLKELALKSKVLLNKVKKEYSDVLGNDDVDLKNPSHVELLHNFFKKHNVVNKLNHTLQNHYEQLRTDRLPNLIFDVTLKDLSKLKNISDMVTQMGYDVLNIHIIWVVNDIEIAIQQNRKRDRVVPIDILIDTHEGVGYTMKKLLNDSYKLQKYSNGDFWLVFNKKNVDSSLGFSRFSGGSYVKNAEKHLIKKTGYPIDKSSITKEIVDKIVDYIPKDVDFKIK